MSNLLSLILLVALPIVAFFLYRRIKGGSSKNNASSGVDNTVSQESYEAKKHPKDEEISLTLEEKIELSWQFLTNITEQILNKFSKEDRSVVHDAGEKMNRHGMSYQHDVKQEAKVTIDVVKSRTKEQKKDKGRAR